MSGSPSRPGATIHARIAAQAALTPNSPALITDRETLTYGELVRRARLLAHFLRGQGARLEEPIGVCLERSADLVVCLLAVLEAGATYLPLDPNYPRERIGFMLEDAQARLLLTRRELGSRTSGHGASSKLEPIFLEELPQASVETPGFEEFSSAQALSHLIYTSGSTGRPKGVAICHHNVTSFFDWAETLFPAEELRGVFAATSICFDLSIFELFFPLTRGGTVILGRDALHLPSHPARAQVTLVNTVPSAITELVRQNALPAGVITVNLAGEPLKRALTDAVYAAAGVQKVYNLYGPSEDTTYSTWVLVPKGSAEEPTIGVPIDGSVGYVLDGALAAVAEGEIGELYLGGLGVSRGYLGRPAQTAERYLPDPFSGEAGARFYRTGDRVRRRADGQLEFLGRVDHQVKIRGFRIELGEIEAALARHPAVEMPLALVREDQQDDPRIVAYFQQKAGLPEPNAQELRQHLAEFLPHFMVPSAFVALAKMPLTPNGKIDRNPLLAMVPPSLEEGPYKAPEGPLETALAGLFAEILGVGRVGRDDSFLELGGHSLLAARLAARIESELGRAIGQRTVFEAPSVAALAAALERGGGRAARGPIPPRDASQKGPLSAGQRGLFYLWQLDPSSPQYATPVALRLRGRLDVAALERSIARLIARHEALRCRFPLTAGVPEALVEDAQTSATAFHLEAVDLRQEPEPFARALAAAQEASKQGFDLEKESSFRVKLWRTGEAEHLLFVNLHHIVTDGVSLEIFFDELGQLYAGECRGEVAHLPTLEAGLLDTVAYLEAEAAAGTEHNLAFWQERLQGIRSIELPSDHPRPATPRHRGDAFRRPLAGHLVAALSEVGRPHGATFFLVATAAFHAWLTRLTGQSDAVLGVPIAGRNHPATRRQLGLFINALPVRVDAGGDPSFLELLARVRQRHLEAWTHEAMPMDRLVAELAPNRQLGRNPFFDLAFQVRDGYFGSDVLPGLAAEHLLVHNGTSKFDLDIALVRRGNELMVEVEYDLELFESATIESFLASFLTLLEDVARRPEARLSALAMVPAAQLAQLSAWNATGGKAPVELSLAELFRRAAAKNPTAKALEYRDETLSYEQLDRLSDALAQRLIAAGVLPGDLVALAGERSARQIAALLAIVKAGAAYVPLDAGYPRERLSFLLEDARPKVLLAEEGLLGKLPLEAFEAGGGRTLLLDGKIDGSAGTSLPTIQVDGSFPAYVIYTSGSTGQPKGVVVPQRAVLRLVFDNRFFELGPQERIAQASNISFDAATFEIWGALLHGGCLVGVERDTLLTADKLRAFLREERISAMWLTASLFHQYARQMPDVVASLGTLLFGGERCDPEAVRKALELGPKRLINGYGPTETTTFAATYEVHEVPAGAVSVPIGRPIGETELWIVDRWGEPLPIGATGELWIGGAGLAHAYLGRPSLTARSFVPHPSSQTPGARLYRSGDLVRLRPDGLFDYVGRIDQQVKVRGFRVELGEIEALLGRHPAVAERAVALQDDGRGSGRLVAYVVPHAGEETSADALRAFLGQTLPDYLVPTAFQFLPQLPLTAHGKIDRRALPAFDFEKTGAQAPANVKRPQSEIERRVSAAWCELFEVEAIDPDAQFFSIGGHSLLAAQLLARLHQQFNLELPLRVVYEHPSISAMARLVESQLLAKLTLLTKPKEAAKKAATEATTQPKQQEAESAGAGEPDEDFDDDLVRPLPPGIVAPLSYGQRRLFFLHLLEPDASIYNLGFALELSGPLDRDALERALEEIERRHDILRTRYLNQAEGPVIEIDPPSPFRFKNEDLRALDPVARQKRLQDELDREFNRGFDLQKGPLWRSRLLRMDEEIHVFLYVLHHIATDGWSQGILSSEISKLYTAYSQGKVSPLDEPSLQYQDFAAWQDRRFRSRESKALFEFWRHHLEGMEPTELATDFPRPAEQSFRGDSYDLVWPPELMPKVKRFSQKQGTSTFITCLSAFLVTLQAFCDRDDLAVGTVIGGRERNELEPLIGFFVNTLILRTRLDGNPTFAEAVRRVRATFLTAHEHSEVPFDQLVESLLPIRDLSRHPFVSMLFQVFDRELIPSIPGLKTRLLEPNANGAKMDLVATVLQRSYGYSVEVEFAADIYRKSTIDHFFRAFLVVLAAGVESPASSLSELPLLDPAQKDLWQRINATATASPLHTSLFELFRQVAQDRPEQTAIESSNQRVTYGELARLAHAIARRLFAEGIRPGDVVGLGLERSIDLVAAILGVAELGATYAPLDPSYPTQRLAFMIEDTAMPLLLTRRALVDSLPLENLRARGGLCLEIESIHPGEEPAGELPDLLRVAPAMIIYTSGSTGQPKGVVVPQEGVVRLVLHNHYWSIRPDDVLSHASNPSFDAASFEIWAALLNGAGLVVIDTDTLLDAQNLRRTLVDKKISVAFLTTALYQQFTRQSAGVFAGLRAVFFGGERCDAAVVRQALAIGGSKAVLHAYGPTETTTFATIHLVEHVDEAAGSVPIGKPIAFTEAFVVDRHHRLLPPGAVGELVLGGVALAHGYLRRPALTARSFVPHPWTERPGERLYRTGDLMRLQSEGVLEFLGRIDNQVKLRGFRIELGEIESALGRHEDIDSCAVVLVRDERGEQQLAAYFEAKRTPPPSAESLRAFLEASLPSFYLPSFFVPVEALPLTPNGKVDRKKLEVRRVESLGPGEERVAPRNEQEEAIHRLWCELFGQQEASVEANFFTSGGHSLLAAQLLARIRDHFGIEIPLRNFFRRPTIAGLAADLASQPATRPDEVEAGLRVGALPTLSFGQRRLFFLYQLDPDSPSYNIPLAIELHGRLNVAALERAIEVLLHRHDVLRTRYLDTEEGPRLELDPPTPFALPIVDLTHLSGEDLETTVAALVDEEMRQPFRLASQSVLRAQLLVLSAEHHVFQLTTHHIASDGLSQQILAEELTSVYGALERGEASPLLPLAHQYSDYAEWLESRLQGERYEKWIGFWRQALEGLPALELPTDSPRPEIQSQRGSLFNMALPVARAERVRAFARGHGETLFTVLLAAFAATLARYSGQRDFGVGTVVAGRPLTELESLVGFFVNTLVLRQRLDGDPSFEEVLFRTRETYLDAQANQEVPFEKLVEELKPPRDSSRPPFVQVVFQVVGMNLVPHLPGLSSALLERHSGTSKFDFAVTALELGSDQELHLSVEYDTALFHHDSVARLFSSFETLLFASIEHPERNIWRLPLVPAGDLERLESFAGTLPYDAALTIPGLLARQMAATPERIALIHEHEEITYAELAGRVARLAHLLRAQGVGCETIVGVCLERSPELVVALMAVLFAGGTYLPLDPAYPQDRLEKMLEDTAAKLLITQAELAERFPAHELLVLEALGDRLAAQPGQLPAPLPAMNPEQIAYLIYTSGSTGRPKGVAITHHNAVAFFAWANTEFSDEELSGVSATVSVCFDVSIFEIFFPITRGGTVILATNVLHILTLPARERIRLLTTVPSAITELLRLDGIPKSVISVGLPGEPLKHALVQQIFEVSQAQVAYNFYGPSEDTTYSTWARIVRSDEDEPPIGKPIANSRGYVVDAGGELLPLGLMGELYLGGDGVSRGYLNRPRITAERYLPDPFSGRHGARLYRTGDRTRWRHDGQLLCFGRFDHQIKLRGFRIELGEIEAVLARHPAILLTLAMVREDVPGDPRLVAYYTRRGGESISQSELREYLRERLPHFMVPAFLVELDEMPLNPNGKTDRAQLPPPLDAIQKGAPAPGKTRPVDLLEELDDIEDFLATQWREVLHLATVSPDDNFFDLGGHSLLVPSLLKKLEGRFPQLRLLDLFRFATIGKLADHLRGGKKTAGASQGASPAATMPATSRDVAIVGLAGRFPQAGSVDELWRHVLAGREGLSDLSVEEMLAAGVDEASLAQREYVRRGAVLEGIELFDADFFAMNAREAQITDPQHRLFLETVWEALERAGWAGEGQDLGSGGRVGVFAGTSASGYFQHHVLSHPELVAEIGTLPVHLGADKDFLATRVAYKLDLTGPAFAVQTACSTSLVAVHLACRSLRDGECDLALAGGATVQIPHKTGYAYVSGSILSPDGHCRAFDAQAAGTIPSSGVGVVVLKRLEDAKRDGDHIVAVIRGSAINNDGAGKVGFTAPSVDGQARVISDALARAGVPARTVGYVECHGTGTQMGDPIEVAALEKVHRAESADRNYCAISSFKTQVGHMDSAAGVGGLIRAALAVERAMIPPNLHFEQPNPELRLEQSPFFVPVAARPWEKQGTPRRAGVSSFGIGGTNAHVVLEEAPPAAPTTVGRPHQLLLLSARSEASLLAHAEEVAKHLESHSELHSAERLADVASTLHRGRRHFPHRLALVLQDGEEAAALLRQPAWRGHVVGGAPPVAFLFPGQGAQYAGMGRDLYAGEPIFRQEIDACASRLEPLLGLDLRSLLFARGEQHESAQQRLQNTALAQPALFVVEWALAQLWLSWGIVPTGLIGHSIGEYVAATLAGVFERDAALELVAARGRRMQELPPGKMLAVRLPESAVYGKLIASGVAEEVTFAAINGPHDVVVSGRPAAIHTFAATLAKAEIETRELKTSHAFHSPMMDGVLDAFRRDVEKAAPQKPRRAFLSNLTGAPIDADLAVSPEYWARHLRHAVRFADGLAHLLADPRQILLEVGPGRTLGTLARRAAGPERAILASLPHPQDERSEHEILLESVARLYTLGLGTSGEAFYAGQKRRRLPLPTTPFERRRFWLEARPPQAFAPAATSEQRATDAMPVMPELAPVQQLPSPILAAAEPQDEVARQIEELWRNLLGAEEKIPFDLDFYEAGGDSLMATQLANRLRKLFGVVVRGNELMADALTIAEQADLLRERLNEKD